MKTNSQNITKEAIEFLSAIIDVNESFLGLYSFLRKKSGLKEVHHGCFLRKYDNSRSVEIYVEVEVNDNLAFCWWVDIDFESETWAIDLSLLKTEDGEQRVLSRLFQRTGSDLDVFAKDIKGANKVAVESVHTFQLN